jgi:hypothetical protein
MLIVPMLIVPMLVLRPILMVMAMPIPMLMGINTVVFVSLRGGKSQGRE